MIEITLPYPPSINHYKNPGRIVRTQSGQIFQKRVNSPETKQYYYTTWMLITNYKTREGVKSFDSGTLWVDIDVFPPDHRKRDLDGILKVLLDSMQRGGLYADDFQIARLTVQRKAIIPNGQVIVRISEIADEPKPN